MMSREEGERRRRLSTERVRSDAIGNAALQQQAALWALRLAGEDPVRAAMDWDGLTAWLERDPAARPTLDRAEAALSFVHLNRRELLADMERGRRNSRAPRSSWIWGTATASLAAAAWLLLMPRTPGPQVWQAPQNATLDVALSDGSKVTLDRSARLEVRLSRRERAVRLSRGSQALFDVARDLSRPFRIDVGTARVSVLGTRFDVDDTPGGLDVAVGRGTVAVEVAERQGSSAVRVEAGERFSRDLGGHVVVTRVAASNLGAWRSGELTYVDAPLAKLARDLSRYWGRPVTLAPGAVRLRFTGVLVIDTPAIMAARLGRLAPITVRDTGKGFVLQARAEEP